MGNPPLVFHCAPDNDLYRAFRSGGLHYARYATVAEAVDRAGPGSGILLLASGYPQRTTPVDDTLLAVARQKGVRVFVEFPSWLPGLPVGEPRSARWERVVVASEAFGDALPKMRILAIHDCRFVPVKVETADLVLARVAGFDKAIYGIPAKDVHAVLFEHPSGDLLVATTQLSRIVTGRYAPWEAWLSVWVRILAFLCPGRELPRLKWTPAVRPSLRRDEPLPAKAELAACQRGAQWYFRSRMLVHSAWEHKLREARKYEDGVAPGPQGGWPSGDGSLGVLEGFSSRIRADGSQWVRWWVRSDCIAESAMALAFSGAIGRRAEHLKAARNLNDFLYFRSAAASGSRADPASPSFGLLGWNTTPGNDTEPGGTGVYYGDDNARSMLGTLAAAALLGVDRWDEPVLRCLLANLRTTGKLGFRGNRIDEGSLQRHGWRYYWLSERVNYAPHYEAYLWACFLWAYNKTGYKPFFERAYNAIKMTVAAYPDQWRWTNGIQQERARMLLPLAWLVRLQDKPEHRQWLQQIARDLLAFQDSTGAIREEIGQAGKGAYAPPKSNEEYGTSEAPLLQENGDPVCDLLYTTNFAFLGLHEAGAGPGEPAYRAAEDRLAEFLVRVQVRSGARSELDGAWFRGFDFRRWEYWASNADAGWGAWSVETGWTQSWITSVLAMRHLGTSLWQLTAGSSIKRHLDHLLTLMIPDVEQAG